MIRDIAIERERIAREIALDDYATRIDEGKDRLRFQVEYSQSAMRNLQLVNGGAVLALLTFIGNTGLDFNFFGLWWAFFWFASGLVCSLAAYFGAFFSQHFFMKLTMYEAWNAQYRSRGAEEPYQTSAELDWGNRALYSAVILSTLSLVSFLVGAFVALFALQ
ncbi:hypothetical protein [Aurantiacibacter aquimixticola]|uniref:Uncharacterized protein n=1 Tax=Aurantiacibacter aquimixticola TaxID=1958945 RepID=A0A419RTY5_9SPHN|nr:hypothetical protein [Aurantiacibacter aquimixticola]RJY09246.1 hypothetical protein D6201_07645 [Aurantiacibacter aquimixticola]